MAQDNTTRRGLCPYPDCLWLDIRTTGEAVCSRHPCVRRREALREIAHRISELQSKEALSMRESCDLVRLQQDYNALRL